MLNKHLEVDSPYNTYRHPGLPPGPICMPSIAAIDAVLDYENHDYLYFCAKDDLSGSHAFARSLAEHNRNAQAYAPGVEPAGNPITNKRQPPDSGYGRFLSVPFREHGHRTEKNLSGTSGRNT